MKNKLNIMSDSIIDKRMEGGYINHGLSGSMDLSDSNGNNNYEKSYEGSSDFVCKLICVIIICSC